MLGFSVILHRFSYPLFPSFIIFVVFFLLHAILPSPLGNLYDSVSNGVRYGRLEKFTINLRRKFAVFYTLAFLA